jgi:hypothetical protein
LLVHSYNFKGLQTAHLLASKKQELEKERQCMRQINEIEFVLADDKHKEAMNLRLSGANRASSNTHLPSTSYFYPTRMIRANEWRSRENTRQADVNLNDVEMNHLFLINKRIFNFFFFFVIFLSMF